MNRQLSYQTEYNTSLLAQQEALEVENAMLRSSLAAAESARADMAEGARGAEQRVGDLHRKLTISSQLCDRLSRQCEELREGARVLETRCQDSGQALGGTREQHKDVLQHNASLLARVHELESLVEASEAGRHWEGSEERAKAEALTSALASFTAELATARSQTASLERELSLLAEENMEVRRQQDRQLAQGEVQEGHIASLQSQLSDTGGELHQLQLHCRLLEQEGREGAESREVLRLEMSHADRAQRAAAETSHRADEKWRSLEEQVRTRERELAVAAEDRDRLERTVVSLEKKNRLAEERWQERERLVSFWIYRYISYIYHYITLYIIICHYMSLYYIM
jgi:chromosome segregation ATPase